ncbi:MAG: DUF3078 domain-containing protein [Bacteroidales bacterium]
MKKVTLLIAGILMSIVIVAQDDADTAWKIRSDISLMFSQSSFTNWAAGGENNINMNGFFNFYAGYEKGKSKWENILGLAFGQSKTGDQKYRKSEDKIDFLSTYGYKAADKWYYSVNANFKSQFAAGYDYPFEGDSGRVKISDFMAPAYISVGPGMEYRPKDYFSLYLSPATARWIIVNDQDLANVGSFGVEPAEYDENGNMVKAGEMSRFEVGAYFRMIFVKDIAKNVNLNTKLELFSDYLEDPQNIDVNWDTKIGLKVNEWISASLGFQLIYDDNTPITDKDGKTGPRTQFMEVFSLGLSYKISN